MPYALLAMSLTFLYAGLRCLKYKNILIKSIGFLALFTAINGIVVSFPWFGGGACVAAIHLYMRGWRRTNLVRDKVWGAQVALGAFCGLCFGIFIKESVAVANGNIIPQAVWAAGALGSTLVLFWVYHSQSKNWPNASSGTNPPTHNKLKGAQPSLPDGKYQARNPLLTFSNVHGQDELKGRLFEAGISWRAGQNANDKHDKKNGLLMYGPPGTGKTMFAEALAGELNVHFLSVSFKDMASKWINQTTEQLNTVFLAAQQQAPCMLFIDEIDSLLEESENGSYEEYKRMRDGFLVLAEGLRGSGVLLAGATNRYAKLAPVTIREGRFDFKVEIGLPDSKAREKLILTALDKATAWTDEATLKRLVQRWAGFNVPRLMDGGREAAAIARARGSDIVIYDDFYAALRKLQGTKGGPPESAKSLDELILDPDLQQRVNEIAVQLIKVNELESAGGSIPNGLLFLGPPGTGKTTTAMALAKACNWTFIERTGRELMQERAIDKLRTEASDLRPAIVFIDEADDILADRAASPWKAMTNELLSLIEGAGGTLHDVVWIAATNHAEHIDEAAMRGGRFTQKIDFRIPSAETMRRIVRAWALKHAAYLEQPDPNEWASSVLPLVLGASPANALAVLATANNIAATRSIMSSQGRAITMAHIREAASEVLGVA
jgi:transitional endoplasmic reticulum ATPase